MEEETSIESLGLSSNSGVTGAEFLKYAETTKIWEYKLTETTHRLHFCRSNTIISPQSTSGTLICAPTGRWEGWESDYTVLRDSLNLFSE